MNPFEKAARIAQRKCQQTGKETIFNIQDQEKLKADRVNTLLRGGFDLGVSYLKASPLNRNKV